MAAGDRGSTALMRFNNRGSLKVSGRVHALVLDADRVHAVGSLDVDDLMAADTVAPVPLADFVAGVSAGRDHQRRARWDRVASDHNSKVP